MVKSKKTKTVIRSLRDTKTTNKDISRHSFNKTRVQLLKMLKDLGIKVPSSLSLDILRELVDQNHDNIRASNTNADDHEFTNCQLPGSYPSFDIESNNGDSMEQPSVNAAERIKGFSSYVYII
ncbi:unnamed protein product [Rotaria magnacalcarata]|uniref:Uncharacterized protein n=2 Tax=Rotaria magnacalcarata TaxID=392030 RepID=A0A816M156_9BILA|nr:unnamed protein product [Rotaria magnacalcarata]